MALLIEALNQTNALILQQNARIGALEAVRQPISPLMRQRCQKSRSQSPRRRKDKRIPAAPEVQVVWKHDHSPPRSQRSPVAKRARNEPRGEVQRSPPPRSKGRSRTPSPRHRYNPRHPRDLRSRSRSSSYSDDDEPRDPLSQEIMSAQLPKGLEKPPPLGT